MIFVAPSQRLISFVNPTPKPIRIIPSKVAKRTIKVKSCRAFKWSPLPRLLAIKAFPPVAAIIPKAKIKEIKGKTILMAEKASSPTKLETKTQSTKV